MLVVGVGYHLSFMLGLRRERTRMVADGLVHGESEYPVSLTLLIALCLLGIGLFAIASTIFHAGPFE
jgi:putative membrane protein